MTSVQDASAPYPFELFLGDVTETYHLWRTPRTIISDGAYGVNGFPGDTPTAAGLRKWYEPHVKAWSKAATLATTLWFWNTEAGWAEVHPLLVENGWQFEFSATWNKGVGQIAGNVNSKTIRRMPVVTEVCVFYSRTPRLENEEGVMLHMKDWLRREWGRAGLPLHKANTACGVKNAATRKYLTQDHLWYSPPGVMVVQLAEYAKKHGLPTERPYFSLDGFTPVTAQDWDALRYTWNHEHGVTNVWNEPSLRGKERYRDGKASAHLNQKPLTLMERIIRVSTDERDVVWEPFGGLCSGAVAALKLGRTPLVSEMNPSYQPLAETRLHETAQQAKLSSGCVITPPAKDKEGKFLPGREITTVRLSGDAVALTAPKGKN